MFITGKHLSRRTVLRGLGATVALPFLDAMAPAAAPARRLRKTRLVCIEMVHGAAGSAPIGLARHLWAPAETGRAFDLSTSSLRPLAPLRDAVTIVSNCDVPSAEPFAVREVGGDHWRSSATFLTQEHPKRTAGADVECGTSIDQLYAQRFGQETPIPSMQLCIEHVDQGGGCGNGYSCTYTDTISWASPTRPLPMIRNPRVVFDELLGVFGSGTTREERAARRREDRSILDWLTTATARLKLDLGAGDRLRLDDYLQTIREVERRLQRVETVNASGEPRELPAAPLGVPDSFAAHVGLMFDLQLLAFRSDITRVFAFKLGRDNSNRTYPESGCSAPFHPASHHGGREDRILEFAKINTYHVELVAKFIEQLRQTPDGDRTLLDDTLLIYGSPMGDSNQHNHKKVPFFIAGHAGGAIKGGQHLRADDGTSLADVMLGVLHTLGLEELKSFGDSERAFDLAR